MPKRNPNKENEIKIKVTTYLVGSTKKAFLNDVKDREETEAVIAREILVNHYRNKSIGGKY